MTIAEREQWGRVPMRLAMHCLDCDLITAAPNNRCAACNSESVAAVMREPAAEANGGNDGER